jgi:RHS repeat-associated protein
VTVRRLFSGGLAESSGNYFYTFDHLGSVREVTDVVGAVGSRYEYDAYGTRTKTLGDYDVQRGFTLNFTPTLGQLALSPGRAYDSNTARWISEDPSGLRGGINRYTYARNAPTNYWDPTGRIAIAAPAIPFIAEGLAALGALLSAALIGWELGEVAPLPPIAVDDPPDSDPPDNVIPFPPEPVEIIITVERPKPTCPPKPPSREARCWTAFALCAAASELEGVGVGQCWDSLAQCLDYPNLTVIFPRPKGNVVYP